MKLGDAFVIGAMPPHIYESAAEAHAFLSNGQSNQKVATRGQGPRNGSVLLNQPQAFTDGTQHFSLTHIHTGIGNGDPRRYFKSFFAFLAVPNSTANGEWHLLGYFFLRFLGDAEYRPVFGPVNLITHEAGHAFFSWSGSRWLTVAGGTLFELTIPVAFAVAFVRQRDPFAVAVALFWLGTALADVSIYAGDARTRALPLVSLWPGAPIHDWAWLLQWAGHPEWDRPVSRLFRHSGLLVMAGSLAWGGLVVRLVRERGRQAPENPSVQ